MRKNWNSFSPIVTIGILSGLLGFTAIGCTNSTVSSVQASPESPRQSAVIPSPGASEKVSLGNAENTPEPVIDQIANGRYWIGHTDQGLEVDGKRYRYDTEAGEQPWKNIADLEYVKKGVVFDGENHWCLSTLAPKNTVASCTANGWEVAATQIPRGQRPEATIAAEFRFYLRQDLGKLVQQNTSDRVMQQEPRIVQIIRTACGAGAIARVMTLPNFTSEEALIPEKVVEVDAENNTRRRWPKPLDSKVLAIEGDRILVEADNDQRYWIDTAGMLERSTDTRSFPSPSTVPYKKHPEFGTSGIYSQQFIDLTSGRDRQIIADAPCT